jgi:hypothetical protein
MNKIVAESDRERYESNAQDRYRVDDTRTRFRAS